MSCCFLIRRTQPTGLPSTGGTQTGSPAVVLVLRRLALVVVLLFVTLMVIFSIAWLVLHPRAPTFTVTSLSVSNFTLSDDSQLSSKYDMVVAIKNPNKKIQVVLDRLKVSVLYDDDVELAKQGMENRPVFLEKMGENNFKVSVESVLKKEVVKDVDEERRNGLVKLKVKFSGRVRYSAGKYWPTKDERLMVDCEDLNVQFHSANSNIGKLIPGAGKDCHVSPLQ